MARLREELESLSARSWRAEREGRTALNVVRHDRSQYRRNEVLVLPPGVASSAGPSWDREGKLTLREGQRRRSRGFPASAAPLRSPGKQQPSTNNEKGGGRRTTGP